MAKKETKRQHYVPRTYLRNFSQKRKEEFYIHSLPNDRCHGNNIFETNIKNVCVQNDFYTLPGNTEKKRQLVETFYSEQLEEKYNSVYEILIDPNKRELSLNDRYLIISTVVTMFYRTTKLVNTHNDFMNRVLARAFDMCVRTGKEYFVFEGENISIKGKTLEQLQTEFKIEAKTSQIMTQLEVAMNLIKLRTQNDGIYVLKLHEPECEFITSDHPVNYHNPLAERQLAPFDPTNLMSMPLDNKHILYLMPYADTETKTFIARNSATGFMCRNQMLTSNYEQFKDSDRFLLGTETALTKYCSLKEISEKDMNDLTNEERNIFKNFVEYGVFP